MNYIMGFLLLVNGGEEQAAFELFVKIFDMEKGIYGFYEEGFPMYFSYQNLFENQFIKKH